MLISSVHPELSQKLNEVLTVARVERFQKALLRLDMSLNGLVDQVTTTGCQAHECASAIFGVLDPLDQACLGQAVYAVCHCARGNHRRGDQIAGRKSKR